MTLEPVERLASYRQRYPIFYYESYEIISEDNSLKLLFHYSTPPDLKFTAQTILRNVPSSWQTLPAGVLENLVFHIGLIEALSYWKATCSPQIVIKAGGLDQTQIEWWKYLLLHGMREYFYVNQIDFTGSDFISISTTTSAPYPVYTASLTDRSLIPLGGGRDSALTAQILYDAGKSLGCMLLNPIPSAYRIAQAVGCPEPIVIQRKIDPALLEVNRQGYLNGHTPFSACLAMLNALCLVLYDYKYIVIANERSSNEGNTIFLGEQINHQYSKSLDFEQRFNNYLRKYLVAEGHYFSFVRPLYELQIGQAFCQYPQLLPLFRSCNRNQKTDSWCGNCPKCLSVFITSYPFMDYERLITVFGSDYFENIAVMPIIRELAGQTEHKPFECVTTLAETLVSLSLSVKKCLHDGRKLPSVLELAVKEILFDTNEIDAMTTKLLTYDSSQQLMPVEFEEILAKVVNNVSK